MEDRYQLRKLQMDVDKKGLEVQKSQQDLDRFVLELEHKYGLMEQESTIDPRTATIKGSPAVRNGKVRTDQFADGLVGAAAPVAVG
jgi:hypothetical protein